MEKILLFSHATAGFIALVTGLGLATIIPKGKGVHKKTGLVFFYAMTWVFISAILILFFVRLNLFLSLIAFFSYFMTYTGYRVLKRKDNQPSVLDYLMSIFTAAWGTSLLIYGIFLLINVGFNTSILLVFVFSTMTIRVVYSEIKLWRSKETLTGKEIILYHLQGMLGAFIASITAFAVQTGARWLEWGNNSWMLWILPSLAITPLIIFWSFKYSKS